MFGGKRGNNVWATIYPEILMSEKNNKISTYESKHVFAGLNYLEYLL